MRQTNKCCVESCNNRANYWVKMEIGSTLLEIPMCGKCLQIADFGLIGQKISVDRIRTRITGTGVWREGEKWKCQNCGNEVAVTNSGRGTLSCCDEEMHNIG